MAQIDYRKAFDSVPHNWIIKSQSLIIVNFLKSNMLSWKTTLFLSHKSGHIISNPIDIKHGIFYRDSLSTLLFCTALFPLTTELNRIGYGYKIDKKSINHLFCMDDLKLFAKDGHELKRLLQTVKKFSDDIGMKFGLEKSTKATFLKRRLEKSRSIELDNNTK